MDGDTGGTIDQLKYHLRDLEILGASGLIIEDKVFPKNNSLDFNKQQVLEQPEIFAEKIRHGKSALRSPDFMLIARIEALVAGRSLQESLLRARHYLLAGADAIVIHSRSKTAEEVVAFAKGYADLTQTIQIKKPLIAIPTLYNSTPEHELQTAGFDLIIYANYLLRSAYQAMKETAAQILQNGRSLEVENKCVSLGELFSLFDKS
jgi:2-methylisocitrate lyase-like PEP mutase family enzyme